MPVELPAEAALLALARRFDVVERRVRQLLAQATRGGDRRALLTEALELLLELRRDAGEAGAEVERSYAVAFAAVALLLDLRDVPAREASRDLGRALAARLDRAAQTAEEGSRRAFATTTEDNLAQGAQDAVTALVDRAGHRLSLGAYALGVAGQAARTATTAGTLGALSQRGDRVVFSSHGTRHPACIELEGQTFPADAAPRPPIHPGCAHTLTPDGYSEAALAAAQARAVRAGA